MRHVVIKLCALIELVLGTVDESGTDHFETFMTDWKIKLQNVAR